MNQYRRPPRAPLRPIPEGWRRFVLLGVLALAVLGVFATLAAVYLSGWLITSAR